VLPARKRAKGGEWFGIQSHDKAKNAQLYVPTQNVSRYHSRRRSADIRERVGRVAGTVRQDADPVVGARYSPRWVEPWGGCMLNPQPNPIGSASQGPYKSPAHQNGNRLPRKLKHGQGGHNQSGSPKVSSFKVKKL